MWVAGYDLGFAFEGVEVCCVAEVWFAREGRECRAGASEVLVGLVI